MNLTRLSGIWRIAQPLYESAEGLGAGAGPDVIETPPAEAEGSLSDHEASYARGGAGRDTISDDEPESATPERGERGRFQARHRAASQSAAADDVPTINAHTKRIKDAEARLGADIVRQDGESERAFTLRRRAELLERQGTPSQAAEPQARPSTAAPQPVQRRIQSVPATFPKDTEFFAIPGNEDKDFSDYMREHAAWTYAVLRQQEREQDAFESDQRTASERMANYNAALPVARKEFPDFDTVVTPDLMVNNAIGKAILASKHGPKIAYFLAKNADVRNELNAEITDESPSAIAATKRYLDTLVAGQRSSLPSPAAAGPTGAAPRLVPPPAPRPPTPVRTGSIAASDASENDDSLSAHEKAFAPKRHAR